MGRRTESIKFERYTTQGREEIEGPLPEESPLRIHVDRQEWVTLYCTPVHLNYLVVGFVFLSGLIDTLSDLKLVKVCADDTVAEVSLVRPEPLQSLLQKTGELTSGCGAGISFSRPENLTKVSSQETASPAEILAAMSNLHAGAHLYRATGGLHACGLWHGGQMIASGEDIGRHNAVDKVAGECLVKDIPTAGAWLLTTGRLSSEMVLKAARLGTPFVISRTSPTTLAARLAEDLGITLVGYVRGGRLNVYTNCWRVAPHVETLEPLNVGELEPTTSQRADASTPLLP